MAIGLTAVFAVPNLKNGDLALFTLAAKAMPGWLLGIVGVAGALSAIVPMSVYMLTIGSMWGKTVLARADTADATKKRRSQLVTLIAGVIALGGSILVPEALVRLSVLSYEGMAQLAPLVILGLWWRDMTAKGAIAGLFSGTVVVVALVATGNDPALGINAGIVGLLVNLIVNVAVSLADRRPALEGVKA
jgi:SSS family solute:Na+ symporter